MFYKTMLVFFCYNCITDQYIELHDPYQDTKYHHIEECQLSQLLMALLTIGTFGVSL